jgi:uncharacterized RDD family membrane protein YckC
MPIKEKVMNIDGEEIDMEKDDLYEKLTFESANLIRRLSAYFIDLLGIIVIWYLVTKNMFQALDAFVAQLGINPYDFENLALYETFRDMVWETFLKGILFWLGIKLAYFTLVPSIFGNGQTIGKLLVGIGTVDYKTLNEVSPTRLMLREFVGRILIEHVFIIPYLVSMFMAFFSKDSRSLHDRIAKTIVIKLDLYRLE